MEALRSARGLEQVDRWVALIGRADCAGGIPYIARGRFPFDARRRAGHGWAWVAGLSAIERAVMRSRIPLRCPRGLCAIPCAYAPARCCIVANRCKQRFARSCRQSGHYIGRHLTPFSRRCVRHFVAFLGSPGAALRARKRVKSPEKGLFFLPFSLNYPQNYPQKKSK